MSTRFGREGLGFAWLILEPLSFCVGVILLWSLIKPEFEHGLRVAPFLMTGYMCLVLMRHQISYSVSAIQANIGLLHHRAVKPVHIYLSRNILEFGGATGAFLIVYIALLAAGQVAAPKDYVLLYSGWIMLGWLGMGLALVMSGLALRFEILERIIGLLTYILVPVSGAFFMVAWLPERAQHIYLYFPFPHCIEMIRAGVFGEFVETHYNVFYALMWGTVLNGAGLVLLASARDRIDVE